MGATLEVRALVERAESKGAERDAVASELGALVSALVDAPDSERPALLARRAVLVTTRDVLTEEVAELRRRAAAAHVADATAALRAADQRYAEAKGHAREQRLRLDGALVEQRAFRNRGRATLPRPEGVEEAIRHAQAVAELAELSAQAAHDAGRVQAQRDAAAAALRQAEGEAAGILAR